jgi:uncharacterized protein (DUF433 family)
MLEAIQWECENLMYHQKPALEPGQDVRTLATYTIPEAASFLSIDPWTLFSWYTEKNPLLTPSGWYGESRRFALLSFRDLEEAYKLHLLRTKHGKSMQYLRDAIADARIRSGSEHPLADCNFILLKYLALDIPARGRKSRKVVPLGSSEQSLYIPEVADTWGKRIVFDKSGRGKQMFPWRFAEKDDESRPVSIDPQVMSGRLVVTGTRIPVIILRKRILNGETLERVADDYGLNPDTVRKALLHFDKQVQR